MSSLLLIGKSSVVAADFVSPTNTNHCPGQAAHEDESVYQGLRAWTLIGYKLEKKYKQQTYIEGYSAVSPLSVNLYKYRST